MTQMLERKPPSVNGPVAPDAEALIEEVRRRTRVRRLRNAVLSLLVATLVGGSLYVATRGSTAAKPPLAAHRADNPQLVNIRAFRQEGTLAFISRGALWVLDGARGTVRELPAQKGQTPSAPQLSADGHWLAYVEMPTTTSVSTGSTLWIARGDGTGAHRVPGITVGQFVGWSPTAEVLAVAASTQYRYPPGSFHIGGVATVVNKVDLVSPTGSVRQLVDGGSIGGKRVQMSNALWAPDGSAIAVASWEVGDSGPAAIRSYPVSGAAPTTWFSISPTAQLPGVCTGCGGGATVPTLAGWWNGWGIGFWVASSGATHDSDNTPLEVLTSPAATPHLIGATLSDGATVATASGPNGELAIVASTGGRLYGQGKVVETCTRATETCSAVPHGAVWNGKALPCPQLGCSEMIRPGSPGSGVTLDPSWSPDGSLLAYEKAPTVPSGVYPVARWYGAHQLYLWNPETQTSREVGALAGAAVPTWSRDGKSLLYADKDGLWLWPTSGGKPQRIVSTLFPTTEWKSAVGGDSFSFFEQVNWTGQFSWSSP